MNLKFIQNIYDIRIQLECMLTNQFGYKYPNILDAMVKIMKFTFS